MPIPRLERVGVESGVGVRGLEVGVDDGGDAIRVLVDHFAEAVEAAFDAGAVGDFQGFGEDGEDGVLQGGLVRCVVQAGEGADVPKHVGDAVERGGVGLVQVREGRGAAGGEAVPVKMKDGVDALELLLERGLAIAQREEVIRGRGGGEVAEALVHLRVGVAGEIRTGTGEGEGQELGVVGIRPVEGRVGVGEVPLGRGDIVRKNVGQPLIVSRVHVRKNRY